ncbi:hypothetical protein [Streptomyces sp. SAI-126]|uniref:MmyB family transcriptional regulator n=1 Tax=Streptomyces sp. SAI-126 TaxID=3377732 RepID=UPI003C7CDF6D
MNQLARALYSPVLADPRRPANTARFVYLDPEAARDFFVDYDHIVGDVAAKLRMEAGRSPHDEVLIALGPVRRVVHSRGRQQGGAAMMCGCSTKISASTTTRTRIRSRTASRASTRSGTARRTPA